VRTVLCSLVASALVSAGLVSATAPAQADHLPAPRQLTVRLSQAGVHAPDSLAAGRYRIELQVPRRAFGLMLLVKPDRGYTRADLRRDDERGGPAATRRIRQSLRFFGGLQVRPGGTGVLWETLYAGRYWVLGFSSETPRAFPIATVRVHGAPSASAFPRVSAEATSFDGGLQVTPRVPQSGRMLIRNESSRQDGLFLMPLARGADYDDFVRWVRHPRRSRPPVRFLGFRQTLPLTQGAGYVLRYRMRAGRYVVLGLEGFRRLLVDGRFRHPRELTEPLTVVGERLRTQVSAVAEPTQEGFVAKRVSRAAPEVPWPAWAVR
jgi:hypothetical protein